MKPDFFDYAVIVAATAGTLVYLFLMILIVGYRRRRTFERVLFFLALAAFLFYSGILLEMNSKLFYAGVPESTRYLALCLIAPAALILPALLMHAHAAYIELSDPRSFWWSLRPWTMAVYATPLLFAGMSFVLHQYEPPPPEIFQAWVGTYVEPSAFQDALSWALAGIVLLTFVVSSWVQLRLAGASARLANATLARFHRVFSILFALLGLTALLAMGADTWLPAMLFAGVLPGALLIVGIVRYRLLDIGMQKNLVYGVTAWFLAILYLALVRRVSGWAEPYFPPEATSAVLIFVLIGFFEPLQRFANRVLRRNVERHLEQLQRLTNELQRAARDGDVLQLTAFAERRIREEFGLEIVKLKVGDEASGVKTPEGGRLNVGAEAPTPETALNIVPKAPEQISAFDYDSRATLREAGTVDRRTLSEPGGGQDQGPPRFGAQSKIMRPAWAGQPVQFRLGKAGAEIGELIAIPIGSSISGETHAALEFLAEQLPGVIELCRAVDEKSRLERELAERERLALVGQMTASISHNLKNPIGSMKTVLQVQLENPRLDENVRRDLQMVLGELDRLGGKLNALLRYARPAVRGAETARQIEVADVAAEIVALMRNEAGRKDVTLQIHEAPNCGCIRGSDEALNDILSNLVVNAIEAVAKSGRVDVRLGGDESNVEIVVADDGPGIPADQISRLFQPFFTTKANGTGLGLAIVRRRAAELGGTVTCKSPLEGGHGTEFVVRLPRMKC